MNTKGSATEKERTNQQIDQQTDKHQQKPCKLKVTQLPLEKFHVISHVKNKWSWNIFTFKTFIFTYEIRMFSYIKCQSDM